MSKETFFIPAQTKADFVKARNNAILRQLDTQLPEDLFIEIIKHLRTDKVEGEAKVFEDQLTEELDLFIHDKMSKNAHKKPLKV